MSGSLQVVGLRPAVFLLAFYATTPFSPQQKQEAPTPQASAVASYPDKPGGLKKLIGEILKAKKAGDQKTLGAYLDALEVPGADEWFQRVFGNSQGSTLADSYKTTKRSRSYGLADTFDFVVREKMTDIDVRRFNETCDPDASEHQYPVLTARQLQEPLYEVRLMHANYGKVLWFFAYIDGGFRYLGELRLSATPFAGRAPPGGVNKGPVAGEPRRIRVGGQVQQAALIHQIPPAYPENARQARLQGTVRLLALIGRDGSVQRLDLLQGGCCWPRPPCRP